MKNSPLLVVLGEPNSVFTELLFKAFKKNVFQKSNNPILLIGSANLLKAQMRTLKYSFKINNIENIKSQNFSLNKNLINIINVNYHFKKSFAEISDKSNLYINSCFKIALELLKKKSAVGLINGPISKTHFLQKKHLGITEYLSYKTKTKPTMLIYNPNFSVCPITTHLPINQVSKKLNKRKIINDVININNFYKKILKKKPKFAVLGLNPHCESIENVSEEKKIIIPSINHLSKNKININGPFSADTFFSKQNIRHYDIVIGMYHDQVLVPMKTIFSFNAINLTLGLPFLRVSPDHGTNYLMIGKNKSDPKSLISSIDFFNNIK